jgi:type I restriction enzyme S subunit
MSLPRYPKYKDSGVEWLGEVPEHWQAISLKRLTKKIGSGITPRGGSEVYASDGVLFLRSQNVYDEGLRLDEAVFISPEIDEEMSNTRVQPGDILLNVTGASLGRTCLVPNGFVSANVNQHVCIIRLQPDGFRSFVAYAMKSGTVKSQIELVQTGAAREGLNFEQIGCLNLAMPPIAEEANAIVSFLDQELEKIDALVQEQRRLIELLKEKRQAVISHAVTKGINSNALMKDYGIEWLGEVPEHWGVKRLKHIKASTPNAFVDGPFGSNLKSEHFIDDGDTYVIESNFATQGRLDTSSLKTISSGHFSTIRRSETRPGDIVIAKIGALFGKAAVLPEIDKPAVVSGNSMKLTVNNEICETSWALWQLVNLKNCGEIDQLVNGSAQPALSLSGMNQLVFLLPPIKEQREIALFLNCELERLEKLITEATHAIDLLQERRTALISAAVTGKIDVRGLATEEAA